MTFRGENLIFEPVEQGSKNSTNELNFVFCGSQSTPTAHGNSAF